MNIREQIGWLRESQSYPRIYEYLGSNLTEIADTLEKLYAVYEAAKIVTRSGLLHPNDESLRNALAAVESDDD